MYRKTIVYLAVFSLFFLSSCNNAPAGELELNNGTKWQVNAEMMPPLKASKQLVSDYANGDKKDYKALAKKLKENNKVLISSCTMTGKSHDELHKWLHPYMGLVTELESAKNETQANQTFEKIEKSFKTFDQYFQ